MNFFIPQIFALNKQKTKRNKKYGNAYNEREHNKTDEMTYI